MSLQAMKYPALNVSAATAELVKGILALYPHAQIVPRVAPLEDEDISVEGRLPLSMDEVYQVRDRVHCEPAGAFRRLCVKVTVHGANNSSVVS